MKTGNTSIEICLDEISHPFCETSGRKFKRISIDGDFYCAKWGTLIEWYEETLFGRKWP